MGRPAGSYGVLRREFEQELLRFADEQQFSLGYAAGVLLKQAFEARDVNAFTRLLLVSDRYLTDAPKDVDPQGELIPVIDRRRESLEDARAREEATEAEFENG